MDPLLASTVLKGPTLELDLEGLQVRRGGETHRLTTLEARVLRYLAERMDQPVTMDVLLREVWGYRDGVVTKAVYESMRRLRRKLEPDPDAPLHLLTEWGTGYRLRGLTAARDPAPTPDPIFGRDTLLATLGALLESARLVTLTGPGGAGKTRLAQAFAGGDTAVWCDLDATQTALEACGAVAGALGVKGGAADAEAAVTDALRARGPTLLLLDNFEQIAHEAPLLSRWLRACPQLRLLVTSRRALHLREERIVLVPPLGAPESPDRHHPAVALLLARIAAVAPDHEIGPAEVAAATRIVAAVDGLPLALEIVAARARLGTLDDLARRVDTSVFDLPSARRDLPARQLSLDVTLTWSWLLLSEAAREALRQLVVFEGTIALDAAERVILLPGSVPLALDELVDANLLRSRGGRLSPYVGVRELARARSPGAAGWEGARERLWRWALGLPDARLVAEVDNLRGAVRLAQAAGEPAMAARLAAVWIRALQLCRPLALAKAELAAWLTSPDVPEPELVELGLLATGIEQLRGDVRAARAELDRITLTAERLGIPWLGRVRLWQGVLLHDEKNLPAAEATYRDALGMLASDTFPGESFRAHMALGYALCEQRRFDEARGYMTEALERAHAIGVPTRTVLALQALGILELSRGRPDAALGWLQSAVELARSTHNEPGELSAACNLGRALTANGQAAEGVVVLEAAVAGLEKMGRKRHQLLTLVYLGQALFAEGRAEEAAGRFRAAIALTASVVAPEGEGAARVGLGRIFLARGEREAAAAELRAGAALLRAAGDEPEAAAAERWIGG